MQEALTGIGGGLGALLLAVVGYLGKQRLSNGAAKAQSCTEVRLAQEDRDLLMSHLTRHAESSDRIEDALNHLADAFDAHRLEMVRFMGQVEGRGSLGD